MLLFTTVRMTHLELTPFLIPFEQTNGSIKYSGFINVQGHSYRVCLHLPEDKRLSSARLECEWKLQQKLYHKNDLIKQTLHKAENLDKFLKDFVLIAESCLRSSHPEPEVWSQHSSHILQQIQELGWKRLSSIDESLSQIELGLQDEANRWHSLRLKLNKQDLAIPPFCETVLPEKFDFHWSGKTRLKQVFQQFEAAVCSYQLFWNVMKEIDENCWILEPEHPTFASTHRRIALGPNISLHITVNCRQPAFLPECRLLGSETAIAELREKLNLNLHRWDEERSLLNNLQEVLDMDFPSPANVGREELSVDCGICYCHRLNEEVPDIMCENKHCGQAFHRSCLYEWLRSVSGRQSFNTIFGECPLCSHPIRVKMPAS